jgi:hypothetical protein
MTGHDGSITASDVSLRIFGTKDGNHRHSIAVTGSPPRHDIPSFGQPSTLDRTTTQLSRRGQYFQDHDIISWMVIAATLAFGLCMDSAE